MTATIGESASVLDDDAVVRFVEEQVASLDLDGRSLCLVIPDATRACPLPLLLGAVHRAVRDRVRSCTAVVALGTHAAMGEAEMQAMVGVDGLPVVNHEWWSDETFVRVGRLDAGDVSRLSDGRLSHGVDVRVNRLVVESDVTLIVGPVLPHEVVGFSGGDTSLFPGLSGPELIDVTQWLGALITSNEIIGTKGATPVRALIDVAAAMVPGERHCLSVVGDRDHLGLRCVAFGAPQDAWAAAADVAAETLIVHLDEPVRRVVSLVSRRYPDLWTGAKGFSKVEPIVADGGEVILYAPHVTEIASTHTALLDIGYHSRDFFVSQWDRFRQYPWGELAHSTHLFGAGTYTPFDGEHQRVTVTLATGIPEETVRRVNLSYLDPAAVDLDALAADPDTLVVPDAGEVLFRLK